MSKFLDRFRYFKQKGETFANGHGQLLETNRDWEDGYRQRWQHDKIVRSTHGVNCTGSCRRPAPARKDVPCHLCPLLIMTIVREPAFPYRADPRHPLGYIMKQRCPA